MVSGLDKSDLLYNHRKRKSIKITRKHSRSINVALQTICLLAMDLHKTLSRSETLPLPTNRSTKKKKKLIL